MKEPLQQRLDQVNINFRFLLEVIDYMHTKLDLPIGTWQQRARQLKKWVDQYTNIKDR